MGTSVITIDVGWLEEEKFTFFFFSAQVCSTNNRTGKEGRGCTARKDNTTAATHVTWVNNKNIKHVANPKEGGNVESEGLQTKKGKVKERRGYGFGAGGEIL